MKTIELSATNAAHARRSPSQNLLCKVLTSPIDVSFSTVDHRLLSIWRPARLLWEQRRMSDAVACLEDAIHRPDLSANIRIPTLFLMAQMHIDLGDSISAEQCIQKGLRSLGQQTFSPRNSSDRVRMHSLHIDEIQPYSLAGREWLTLAIQSLTKGDLECCLRWIHQADRAISCSATTPESQAEARLIGDQQAVLACAMAQLHCFDEAERCLVAAYRSHLTADHYESACRDLILTSRLATIQCQPDRASSILDAAECQLIFSLPQNASDTSPLADIIRSDRYAETAFG